MSVRQLTLALPTAGRDPYAAFAAGPSSQAARAVLSQTRVWPGGALALIGPSQSGKTHLARAWARDQGAVVLAGPPAHAPGAGALVLEDADRWDDEPGLFRVIDAVRAREAGPALFTARTPPALWPATNPDLASRLRALSHVELGEPDEAEMTRLVDKLCADRGLEIRSTAADRLMTRGERSFAAVAWFVAEADARLGPRGRTITRALAQEILDDEHERRRLHDLDAPAPVERANQWRREDARDLFDESENSPSA